MKKILPLILGLTVLLAACGPDAAPTIDAASVQASAVAMAFTMSAQTQIALPTATATLPPTETFTPPPPSPTLLAFPTFAATATTASEGVCYTPMMKDPPGRTFIARIWNTNKAPIQGNVCLYADRGHGVTGIIGIQLGKNADIILNLPQGCYSSFFWVNDPKKPSQASGTALCANNGDKWTFKVGPTSVVMLAP